MLVWFNFCIFKFGGYPEIALQTLSYTHHSSRDTFFPLFFVQEVGRARCFSWLALWGLELLFVNPYSDVKYETLNK